MTGWRLAARLARRQVRRRPGRAALVVALIGLPVAGIVAGGTLARTAEVRPDQEAGWVNGAADTVLVASADPVAGDIVGETERLVQLLPSGSRAVVTHARRELVRVAGGPQVDLDLRDLPRSDPLVAGVRALRSGKLPAGPDEIAVSAAVLRATGGRIGDRLELARSSTSSLITGVVADPSSLDAAVGVTGDAIDPRDQGTETRVFVDFGTEPGTAPVAAGMPLGGRSFFHEDFVGLGGARSGPSVPAVQLFGGIALAVAAIVVAAAFVASGRRHLHELGLLAASGAAPHHLARVMVVEGMVLGAVGAATGVAAGLGAVAALAPRLDTMVGHVTGGPRLAMSEIGITALLGVTAATVAAWMHARTAHWLPVLAALAGRRPLPRVPRYVPVVGTALIGAGLALLVWVGALPFGGDLWQFSVVGGVCVLLGATVLAPAIVAGLDVVSRRTGGTTRLALRSLVRQRARSAAVVSAVMAATGLTVAASAVLLGDDAVRSDTHVATVAPDQVAVDGFRTVDAGGRPGSKAEIAPDAVEAVVRLLPGSVRATRYRALAPAPPGGTASELSSPAIVLPRSWMSGAFGPHEKAAATRLMQPWVASAELLDALGLPAAAGDALRTADALVLARAGTEGRTTATLEVVGARARRITVASLASPEASWGTVVVPPERMAELGLEPELAGVLLRSPRPLTDGQRHALDMLNAEGFAPYRQADRSVWVSHEDTLERSGRTRALILTASVLLTVGVVALGLALAAAEGRQEAALLGAVGATRRTTRRVRAVQAGTIATMGGLLGIPVGFTPIAAYLAGVGGRPIVFPTGAALTVGLAIPVAAAAAVLAGGWVARNRSVSPALLNQD